MIFWLLVLFGGVGAFLAFRSGNFYKMWAILFNIIIAIYLSIMVSPFIITMIPSDIAGLDYQIAACVLGIAILIFGILQTIAVVFLTGDCEIKFPKLFDSIGSSIFGFLCGWFAVSFIVLVFCIMPFMKSENRPDKPGQLAVKSVVTASNFISSISIQRYNGQAQKIIDKLTSEILSKPKNTYEKVEEDQYDTLEPRDQLDDL